MIGAAQLRAAARRTLLEHGFAPDFSAQALEQASRTAEPDFSALKSRDLSSWLWSSIDNDESRDLDQIEFAKSEAGGTRVYVAIADVNCFVPKGTPVDARAQQNTTSIYTGIETFPMLPEHFSTDLSSLLEGQKRSAIVMEFLVDATGKVQSSDLYAAVVQNRAQLTYGAVASWLRQKLGLPGADIKPSNVSAQRLEKIKADAALQDQLLLQYRTAEALRKTRHAAGALSLQVGELAPTVLEDGQIHLETKEPNEATHLIEEFMIAANQASNEYLRARSFPIFQRVVRVPKRWDRIVELAKGRGTALPAEPDAPALEAFLSKEHVRDPNSFSDLSLAVVKLLGRGEYVVEFPGQASIGHFGLAIAHYSHSTAPNRRYPDLVTQRLLQAVFAGAKSPYPDDELSRLALRCTTMEDEANKAERFVHKCVAAAALTPHIGQVYDGFITGSSDKGIWVRIVQPPIEGKIVNATRKLDVGDKIRAKLVFTDPLKGYIDFNAV